jgi:hypothetical protein
VGGQSGVLPIFSGPSKWLQVLWLCRLPASDRHVSHIGWQHFAYTLRLCRLHWQLVATGALHGAGSTSGVLTSFGLRQRSAVSNFRVLVTCTATALFLRFQRYDYRLCPLRSRKSVGDHCCTGGSALAVGLIDCMVGACTGGDDYGRRLDRAPYHLAPKHERLQNPITNYKSTRQRTFSRALRADCVEYPRLGWRHSVSRQLNTELTGCAGSLQADNHCSWRDSRNGTTK